jgi:thymidylate kinase
MRLDMGKWICVTGIDGSGKTTIAKYLKRVLPGKTSFFKFPSEKWVKDALVISGDNRPGIDAHTDLLILATSNRLDDYKVRELLKVNDYVVSQRGWLDMYPYHLSIKYDIDKLTEYLRPGDLLIPDVFVYLRCGYEAAYDWIKNSKSDKFEVKNLMRIHERNFEEMLRRIRLGNFPVDVSKMVVIEQNTSHEWDYIKSELLNKIKNIGIL